MISKNLPKTGQQSDLSMISSPEAPGTPNSDMIEDTPFIQFEWPSETNLDDIFNFETFP